MILRVVQQWRGHVLQVEKETFFARLTTVVGAEDDLDAEIYIHAVNRRERARIQVGAIFSWRIGSVEKPTGRRHVSVLRFHRAPVVTDADMRKHARTAQATIDVLREITN